MSGGAWRRATRAHGALVAAALTAAACGSGERLAACDALLATVEKIDACGRLAPTARAQLGATAQTLDEALDRLAAAGLDQAPAPLVEEARRTCTDKDAELKRLYEKVAPDCLR